MSERSIAEIVGWTPVGSIECQDREGCCTHVWRDPAGETWDLSCAPPEIQVDELLAWLTRDGFAGIGCYPGPGLGFVAPGSFGVYITFRDKHFYSACRPTFLVALEDIVRQVDQHSSLASDANGGAVEALRSPRAAISSDGAWSVCAPTVSTLGTQGRQS